MSTDPRFPEDAMRADYAWHDRIVTAAAFAPDDATYKTWRSRADAIEHKWAASPHSKHWEYLEYVDAVCDEDWADGRTPTPPETDGEITDVQRRSFQQARDLTSRRVPDTQETVDRYGELAAAADQAWNDYQTSQTETRDSRTTAEQGSDLRNEPAGRDRQGSGTGTQASAGRSAVADYQPGRALSDAVTRTGAERDEVER